MGALAYFLIYYITYFHAYLLRHAGFGKSQRPPSTHCLNDSRRARHEYEAPHEISFESA